MSDEGFATEREKWQEMEAVKCENSIKYLQEMFVKHLAKMPASNERPRIDHIHLITAQMHDIALKINYYAGMADNFRRARLSRLESERFIKRNITLAK